MVEIEGVRILLGIQWTLTNPNTLGPPLVQISEKFRISENNIGTTSFFLMHIKIAMTIINMGFRGVRISVGTL